MSKTDYPIYIPTKGRWETCHTARRLSEMDCPFFLVVEETEAKKYRRLGLGEVLVLPFHDLGKGSIPARNWIWDHAKSNGHARHWVMDDNVVRFYRTNFNRRIPSRTAAIFRCIEHWCDRYENIAFAGLQYMTFAVDRRADIAPFQLNTRVYSMILVNTDLPYRWRGRYNEDTDICLRALKDGWCTVVFNAFLGDKTTTMKMRGGNTDNVYNTGDKRLAFARSLAKQHPDVARVVWRYDRWHHHVDYSSFRRNALRLRKGITPTLGFDEHGMRLVRLQKPDTDEKETNND
jgi:hypothetical protein